MQLYKFILKIIRKYNYIDKKKVKIEKLYESQFNFVEIEGKIEKQEEIIKYMININVLIYVIVVLGINILFG